MTSLADLVGQSLMLSFAGKQATSSVLDALERTRAGGVILFAPNIGTPAELYELVAELQTHAAKCGLPPLLVAIDQEGGLVGRLPTPWTTPPSQMAQTATGNLEAAYDAAYITGQQLRAYGINTNFAPVLDVNNNPANPVIGTRSYGEDVGVVTAAGLAALRGYRAAGVIATVKHFPGHGDTDIDSHLGLPIVHHGNARLTAIELAPFISAFEAGAPALMTAHIIFGALDELPATLSRPILTELLREQLGYDGLVFTDALEMRAIADTYGATEAALLSKAAGADVLLPLGRLDHQVASAQALVEAIEAGRLSRSAFESTQRRVERLRSEYALTHALPPFALPDGALHDAALNIARRSITVLHGQDSLPLPSTTQVALVDCVLPRFSAVEEAWERSVLMRELVTRSFPHTKSLTLSPEPRDDELAAVLAMAERSEVVLLLTRNAFLLERQQQLAQLLLATGKPVIHVAARSPYDAAVISGSVATLLIYGDPVVSLEALVDVLAGHVEPQGQLPVTLPYRAGAQVS